MNTPIEEIRLALAEVLKSRDLNIDEVIGLSSKLAQADNEHVRFTTDAGIINRLGRELVAKQETAVAELIKNAYDADAIEVRLNFIEAEKAGGTLLIEDNGLGMTREQLINGFMRLASADKITNPNSSLYSRKRAGRKGIGRFAVQRLGQNLTIVTQTANNDTALKVEVNWESFTSGKELSSVSSTIQEIPKERVSGTTLEVRNLHESWDDATVLRIYKYVTELLQPFPLHTSSIINVQNDKNHIDPGFKVAIIQSQNGIDKSIIDEENTFLYQALAVVEGYVDNNGSGKWKVNSDRYNISNNYTAISKERNEIKPYSFLKNVSIKAYYFIWAPGLYAKATSASLNEFGRANSGIKLYRNGFRVLPYGEKQDDWLGLDASMANREILPQHANRNFIGYVEIVDPIDENFSETSSREGLIENDAFRELKDFCSRVLKAATLPIAEARHRKQTRNQRDWVKERGNPDEAIKAAAEQIIAVV